MSLIFSPLSRALTLAAVSASASFILESTAHSAIVFDNITNATFNAGGYRVGEYPPPVSGELAFDFRVSTRITLAGDGSWRLTNIGLRVSRDPVQLGAGIARVWLAEATEGSGPAITHNLGTISTTSTTSTTVGIEGLATQNITLLGGHSYWITLGALSDNPETTRLLWYRSSLGVSGTTYSDDLISPQGYTLQPGSTPGIKIAAEAIPAPGACALLGLCGVARSMRRRR